MRNSYISLTAAKINVKIGNVFKNANEIIDKVIELSSNGCNIALFPELCLTSKSCGDMFYDLSFISVVEEQIDRICLKTKNTDVIVVFGAPILFENKLYNSAVVVFKGKILGIVPKTHLNRFDCRYFASGDGRCENILFGGEAVPFNSSLIFGAANYPQLSFCIDVGDEIYNVLATSNLLSKSGVNLVLNPCCEAFYPETKEESLCFYKAKSKTQKCGILASCGGEGESSSDCVYAPYSVLSSVESIDFAEGELEGGVLDLQMIAASKLKQGNQLKIAQPTKIEFELSEFHVPIKKVHTMPYLKGMNLKEYCENVFEIAVKGLVTRMKNAKINKLVLGLSGGIDSTLAMLIAREAVLRVSKDIMDLTLVSMPCFGTTEKSHSTTQSLYYAVMCNYIDISIKDMVTEQLTILGHDFSADIAYENAQARARTANLLTYANMVGGLVVGTGDLSEIALGFATYGGDALASYNVNCSILKTVAREIILILAKKEVNDELKYALYAVAESEISPELLPLNFEGEQKQSTEDIVGKYEYIDFILYYHLTYSFSKNKILRLMEVAFNEVPKEELEKAVDNYFARFYRNQFKRNVSPDGALATSLNLNPRNGATYPSDM